MTADQLRECREDFMEWFRTTSPQTLDFTLQSTIREFAYQAWKDATIKANTRPTAVASHAEGVVAADDPQTDREALVYLMQAFDTESWQCPRCGHDEDCATMDSAYFLRDYLRDHPPRSGDEARDAVRNDDLRNLIYASVQFEHRGETDLSWSEMSRLTDCGWMIEGENNGEFDITEQGQKAIEVILQKMPSLELEMEAARYRWLRALPRNYDGRKNGFHVTLAKAKDKPSEWFIESMRGIDLDQAIDAAMAARGDDK